MPLVSCFRGIQRRVPASVVGSIPASVGAVFRRTELFFRAVLQWFVARLSVCIVNWNTCDDLQACLQALTENPYTRGQWEIVVVDNASGDGSAAMVRQQFPEAILLANDANENYARGTNQALARATGDLLLLLNPDVQVLPGSLDALAHFLSEHPDAGAVAARLVHGDGRVQKSVRGFPTPSAVLFDMAGLARLFPKSRTLGAWRQTFFPYDSSAAPAPQPMASCFLLTRKAYNTVGGMDERFPLYFNDVDWCLRAKQAGQTIWYTSRATVLHGYGGTTRRNPNVQRIAAWESHRALLRFWAKHYKISGPARALLTALVTLRAWQVTGRWGQSLGRNGGETTPADLRRQLERA